MALSRLNLDIYVVVTTQFKRDMNGADKRVEEAGYVVRKGRGRWEVYNPVTGRCIYSTGSYRVRYIYFNWYVRNYSFDPTTEVCRFDFVGALNKAFNTVWYELQDKNRNNDRPTLTKYGELEWAKYRVKNREKDIEKIEMELKALQKRLIEQVRWEEQARQDLRETRKRLGLAKK